MTTKSCRNCAFPFEGTCEPGGECGDKGICEHWEDKYSAVKGIGLGLTIVILFYVFVWSAYLIFE